MHIANLPKLFARGDIQLPAGQYLIEDSNAGELLAMGAADKLRAPILEEPKVARGKLFMRAGGFGDLLFLTPTLQALHERGESVAVSCWPRYAAALAGVPFVKVMPYPLPLWQAASWRVTSLENVIEREVQLHAVDALAAAAGVQLDPARRKCLFTITETQRALALARWPRNERPRLGVQTKASASARCYPAPKLDEVLAKICNGNKWELFIFGTPGSEPRLPNSTGVFNLTTLPSPPDFIESCAILTTCDAVLAPDSALLHVAGALDIPAVGLYGPFPYWLRTEYHPSVRSLQGTAPCAPCFHHVRGGQQWPEGMPCETNDQCSAMVDIQPDRIVREVEKLRPVKTCAISQVV